MFINMVVEGHRGNYEEKYKLLEEKALYEFQASNHSDLYGNRLCSIYLGVLKSHSKYRATFVILASDSYSCDCLTVYFEYLQVLKRVGPEDLPLYVGWAWKSAGYSERLKSYAV
jgi:hypothetical protein